jgi:uncharacterized membrane protein YphA (DoxX/SURF4 family)
MEEIMTARSIVNEQVAEEDNASPIVRHLPTAARLLLGLTFFVFGLNGFFNFIPRPAEPPPEAALAFIGALLKTGYMFPLIKGVEVIAGALLLSNRFVPLALTVLAPIVVNIVAFHSLLAPAGIAVPLVVVALEIYLAWTYRDIFRPMLAARAGVHGGVRDAEHDSADAAT